MFRKTVSIDIETNQIQSESKTQEASRIAIGNAETLKGKLIKLSNHEPRLLDYVCCLEEIVDLLRVINVAATLKDIQFLAEAYGYELGEPEEDNE